MAPRLIDMSLSETQAVQYALQLLHRAVPEEYAHFVREIRSVEVVAGACGINAIACTAGDLGRRVNLEQPPDTMDLIDLAVTLSHEARHHDTDEYGRYRTIDHTCGDCSDPEERARDTIYMRDEVVQKRLERLVRLDRMRGQPLVYGARPQRSGGGFAALLGVTALAGLVVGGAMLALRD